MRGRLTNELRARDGLYLEKSHCALCGQPLTSTYVRIDRGRRIKPSEVIAVLGDGVVVELLFADGRTELTHCASVVVAQRQLGGSWLRISRGVAVRPHAVSGVDQLKHSNPKIRIDGREFTVSRRRIREVVSFYETASAAKAN